jgi:diguanylate cyclase (GGDEF)-like protein
MTWSIHLTLWVLPPILAILLVTRDVSFLWPRHRETGTRALMTLAGAAGAWALLDLVAAVSVSPETTSFAQRMASAPAAAAPVAWAWFALGYAGLRDQRRGWPMLLLIAAAAAGGVLEVVPTLVAAGPGRWIAHAARFGGVVGATWVVAVHLLQLRESGRLVALAVTAGAVALAPGLARLVWPGVWGADLSSTGFALGGALLVWGLIRPLIGHLGPVDRDVVLRELRDPIVVMDGRGRMVDLNRAARAELGLVPYGDVPVTLGTLWARGPAPQGTPPTRIVLGEGGEAQRSYEVTLTPLGEGRQKGRSAFLLRDVTAQERIRRELERANADLERLARTDPLTGLANRRHFMETLDREVERSQRYGRPLSLVLIDLDHFKGVNDTHGHAAGDDVLRAAADALRSVCRDVDLAARLGGEELAILLPETDSAGARVVAERTRERIEAVPHRSPGGAPFTVTASLGVATATGGSHGGEELLQASDEALYRAKDEGRNRVVIAR